MNIKHEKNKLIIEFPEDVLSVDIEKKRETILIKMNRISPAEKAVLNKLLTIKFEERTWSNIKKKMTEAEIELIKELQKRKLVTWFKNNKYPKGVLNIVDEVYPIIAKQEKEELPDKLEKGYLVVEDPRRIREISEKYKPYVLKGLMKGMKGFDGKYYLVTVKYLHNAKKKILEALDEEKTLEEIAKKTGLEEEGCKAVLWMMAENGEVMEKRKGIFVIV